MYRRAFSLIEVLVVTAVLGVLVSVVSVSLRAGKEYSKAVVCAGNLRQVTLAALIYTQDNGTYPYGFSDAEPAPPPGGLVGNTSYDWPGWWWFHSMYDSLGSGLSVGGSLWCPSRFILESNRSRNILCSNYGANFSLCRVYEPIPQKDYEGQPVKPTSLCMPGRTLLFMDAGYAWVSRHCVVTCVDAQFPNEQRIGSFYLPGLSVNQRRSIDPDQSQDALSGRHYKNTMNIAFADGHLKRISPEVLLVPEEETQVERYSPVFWSATR